jgi:hypothetical protein
MLSEQFAKAGVAVTGSATGIAWMSQAEMYVKFVAAVIAALVGAATLVYYVLAGIEKFRALRKKG